MARALRDAAAAPQKMVAVQAVEPILHDGVRYEPGALMEIEQQHADRLVASGAAALAVVAQDQPVDGAEPAGGDTGQAQLPA